jgi:hypothetical protein
MVVLKNEDLEVEVRSVDMTVPSPEDKNSIDYS